MTQHLEILVEELSCERALVTLLPKIIPGVAFSIRTFNGKPDLLKKLPQRLAGYRSWSRAADIRLVVVVDRDDDDCLQLKARLELEFAAAGLTTLATARQDSEADGCTRIAVEELEAWFFGDVPALRSAFPRVPAALGSRRAFRDADAIAGGTAEALERVLAAAGGDVNLRKVATAEAVAIHMDVESNTSQSFQAFRDGVRRLVLEERAS